MRRRSQQGITLIELMVTMAILAVIAAIAIPAYNGYISSSYRAECQNEVAAIRLAEEEFFLENATYFDGANASALKANSGGIYDPSSETIAQNTNCTYNVTSSNLTLTYTITANGDGNLAGQSNVVVYVK